jgi:membrane-associated phospholipid phosphatase
MTWVGAWTISLAIAAGLTVFRAKTMPWRLAFVPVVAILLSMAVEGLMRINFAHASVGNVLAVLTEQANNEAVRSTFPSGHTARITVLAAFGVSMLPISRTNRRLVLVATVGAVVIDRLQFSGHTMSDMVGGILLGAIASVAAVSADRTRSTSLCEVGRQLKRKVLKSRMSAP